MINGIKRADRQEITISMPYIVQELTFLAIKCKTHTQLYHNLLQQQMSIWLLLISLFTQLNMMLETFLTISRHTVVSLGKNIYNHTFMEILTLKCLKTLERPSVQAAKFLVCR